MGIHETYFNIIKTIYDKPAANIILNGKILKAFPLRSGTKYGCLTTFIYYNIGSPSCKIQTIKYIEEMQIGKEEGNSH